MRKKIIANITEIESNLNTELAQFPGAKDTLRHQACRLTISCLWLRFHILNELAGIINRKIELNKNRTSEELKCQK